MNPMAMAVLLAALNPHSATLTEPAPATNFEHKQPQMPALQPEAPSDWHELVRKLDASLDETALSDRRLRRKLTTCERCHSIEGSRSNSFLPLLQGQNRHYLARKLLDFKTRDDVYHPLRAISQSLSLDDIVVITNFYARQSSPLQQGLSLTSPTGSPVPVTSLLQACMQCHGHNGNGSGLIPDITGQNENYLAYRIREINRGDSKTHRLRQDGAIPCRVELEKPRDSRQLARVLTLAIDPAAVIRGESIYSLNCASCHDRGEDGAPRPDQAEQWHQRLARGFRQLERNALLGKQKMPQRGGNRYLSRNQLRDAIHFMLSRTGLFSISAPF